MLRTGHKAQETKNHTINTKFAKIKSLENHKFYQYKASNTGQMGQYGKYHESLKHQWLN